MPGKEGTFVEASHCLLSPGTALAPCRIGLAGGRIASIEAWSGGDGRRRLALPAFANAHDHARPLPMSSFGTAFLPLEAWLPRSILATPPDPYLAALAPFARAARSGCAASMVHYTRPSGTMDMVDEARAVARAADDVGIRIALAPALRDVNPLVYGDEGDLLAALSPAARETVRQAYLKPPLPVSEMIAMTEAIAEAVEGPLVTVQFGPAGMQWCSRGLLEAIAERSALTGRRVHMHLLETPYQRAWADETFPQGIVTWLKEIGLLSERLSVAHCIHATDSELDMIAEAGTTIVTNTSSNLHLRSGIARIGEAARRGCRVAIGMDGQTLDEDDDMLREMRLTHALHGGLGFRQALGRPDFLFSSVAEGRSAIGAPGEGCLTTGAPADILVLDLDALDRDAITEVDPVDLLFARATRSLVETLVVGGRIVVDAGQVVGVDLTAAEAELRTRYRHSVRRYDDLAEAWPEFETALGTWFRGLCPCC